MDGFPADICETALRLDLQEPLCVSTQADPRFLPSALALPPVVASCSANRDRGTDRTLVRTKTNPNRRAWCIS